MRAWPDAAAVGRSLSAFARRRVLVAALRGIAAGCAVALAVAVAGAALQWPIGSTRAAMILVAGGGAIAAAWRGRSTTAETARAVEARAPECRNIVITAAEIIARPAGIREDVGARICRDAAAHLARLRPGTLFPARALGIAAGLAVTVAAVAGASLSARAVTDRLIPPVAPDAAELTGVEITVTPPAYARQPTTTLRDPDSVAALAGSRIDLRVGAAAARVGIETATSSADLTADGPRRFTGSITAEADGFLAIQPTAADGTSGPRRLMALTVIPDRPPSVQLTAPGRDLLLPDGARALAIAAAAEDDFGLAGLEITFTKVTGSGENFTFATGPVPATIARGSDRAWTAAGAWDLTPLALEPGDMVVYRAIARDRRPGAVPVESDAFIVEIVAPGSVAAEGFAVDDQRERYALSQRMIILKTERLIAARPTLSAEAFTEEALRIAAEQRQVRAEFIFMMGGTLDHEHTAEEGSESIGEEAEAAGEGELLAGRLRNQGRNELLLATRRMADAAISLNGLDAPAALTAERAALDLLQRAFAKNRYLLRALSQREQLDEARRLSGARGDVAPDPRATMPADESARRESLRRVLGDLIAIGRNLDRPTAAADLTSLAEAALRIDAASAPIRDVAGGLSAVAGAVREGRAGDARAGLDQVARDVAALARGDLPDAPGAPLPPAARRLRGGVRGGGR